MIPKKPLSFAFFVSRPFWKWALPTLFAVLVAETLGVSLSYFFGRFIQSVSDLEGLRTTSLNQVWYDAGLYALMLLLMGMSWRISGFCGMRWVTYARTRAYDVLFAYLTQHSRQYFASRFAGSLSQKISNASNGVDHILPALIWNWFARIIQITATLLFISQVHANLGWFVGGWLAALIGINAFFVKWKLPLSYANAEAYSTLKGKIVDIASNIVAVHHYARHPEEEINMQAANQNYRKTSLRSWFFSEIILSLNSLLQVAFFVGIIFISLWYWQQGLVSIGELVMIISLVIQLEAALVFIGMDLNKFMELLGEIKEGLDEILKPHEIQESPTATVLKVQKGNILLQNVGFTYEEKTSVFQKLNLEIPAGEKVGIVGSSGGGKTTLTHLLLRMDDPQSGQIFIDGQDIKSVTLKSLRKSIAFVPQDPALFHRTITENIGYGAKKAPRKDIEKAAKMAQAHDFITKLPEQYKTIVGERGVKLSGGQRQRIAIARAMLKNAPILILDEATSSLDSESEGEIQKALQKLMEKKTVVAIAHRLSTLRKMDRILVVNKGRVVEDGNHQQLLRKKGLYARLWTHQVGGFLQDE